MRKRIELTTVNLPDWAGEKPGITIFNNHILFVEALHDSDAGNPLEDQDGIGHIYSASNRHINHKPFDELRDILQSDADAIPLSYFEHGRSLWFVQNSPAPAGVEFQWDGVRFAGVWVPDQCVRESYSAQDGLSRKDWMVKQAECACEEYTNWCNGDVYGFSVHLYRVRKDDSGEPFDQLDDYRRDAETAQDSCFGFYGWDYFKREMHDAAHAIVCGHLSDIGFSKRAINAALKNVKRENN